MLHGGGRIFMLLALTALALAGNIANLPLFFGVNILLGSIFAILALLTCGRWGLLVGFVAATYTLELWGHPWALPAFLAELLWLQVFIEYHRRRGHQTDDGLVVMADLGYWVFLGFPLGYLLYSQVIGFPPEVVQAVLTKQVVNGVANSAFALALFLLWRGWRVHRRGQGDISVRGITIAVIFFCILVPALAITLVTSRDNLVSIQQGQLEKMRLYAGMSTLLGKTGTAENTARLMMAVDEYLPVRVWVDGDEIINTDPVLFAKLAQNYSMAGHFETLPELGILAPDQEMPEIKKWMQSYWVHEYEFVGPDSGPGSAMVVASAAPGVKLLQAESARMLLIHFWVMLFGGVIAWFLSRSLSHQLLAVLDSGGLPRIADEAKFIAEKSTPLALSLVREINVLVRLINDRISKVVALGKALHASNQKLEKAKQQLEHLSRTDPLTNLANRREFDRRIGLETERALRTRESLSCLMLDIDFFKSVNDNYGHRVGDHVLQHVARLIHSRIRSVDCLGRVGGEEFALLLAFCEHEIALEVAEEIRQIVDETPFRHEGQDIGLTISIGVATFNPGVDDAVSLLQRADLALYRAKRGGRNCVVSSREDEQPGPA